MNDFNESDLSLLMMDELDKTLITREKGVDLDILRIYKQYGSADKALTTEIRFEPSVQSPYSHSENVEFAEANIAALAAEENVHAQHYAEMGKNTFWAMYAKAFYPDAQAKPVEVLKEQWKNMLAFKRKERKSLLSIWETPEVQAGLEGPTQGAIDSIKSRYQHGTDNHFLNNSIAIYVHRGIATDATTRRRILAFGLGVYSAYNQFREGRDSSVETAIAAIPIEKQYEDFAMVSNIRYFDNPANA